VTRGRRHDELATPEDVRGWLARHMSAPSTHTERLLGAPATARTVHAEAHRLREAIRDLFEAHGSGSVPDPQAVFAINRALDAGVPALMLRATEGGFEIIESERGNAPLALLAPIARAAAEILTEADPTRLRECAAPGCATWFYDTSKGGQRRWCSMARCGNRRKAARHRHRSQVTTER
jgi:predicted RNA-binding Zn ribbon-like protein